MGGGGDNPHQRVQVISLYSDSLYSHQVSVKWWIFAMWWDGKFTSWMYSWKICINCLMLSISVSSTLLNQCCEDLRQLWKQKWAQSGTSKVHLIKWPVSVQSTDVVYKVHLSAIFKMAWKISIFHTIILQFGGIFPLSSHQVPKTIFGF